jgi:hypothetical protein
VQAAASGAPISPSAARQLDGLIAHPVPGV